MQEMEGRPDHDHREKLPVGAVEPAAPSSSSLMNPAPVVSGEEKPPVQLEAAEEGDGDEEMSGDEEDAEGKSSPYPLIGISPDNKYYDLIMNRSKEPHTRWWSDAEDNDKVQRIRRRETEIIAREALEFYNQKEGVKYVFDEPRGKRNALFHLTILNHVNFTAKEDENSPSSQLFFAETVTYYGGGLSVVDCVKLDAFAPDRLREGCIYCPKDICHPPAENCEYGTDEIADNNKFYSDD